MKRIFLLVGLTSFYAAAGQQKDLFDIDRHLQNKSTKKAPLKLYEKHAIKFKSNRNHFSLNYTLPNGDRVITYPGYNMPVVIPSNSLVYNMPTLYIPGFKDSLQKQRNYIPNPAIKKP